MPAGAHSTNSGGAESAARRCAPPISGPGVAVRLEFGARVELLAAELHRLRRRDQRLGNGGFLAWFRP